MYALGMRGKFFPAITELWHLAAKYVIDPTAESVGT